MQSNNKNQKERKVKTPFYLKIVQLLKPLYKKIGVNYLQMELILKTKMKVDARSNNFVLDGEPSEEHKKETNEFLGSLWV